MYQRKDYLKYFILQVFLPLIVGLLIYSFRNEVPSRLEFILIRIESIRLPQFILFHLSDSLWAYSLTSLLVLIRVNDTIRHRVISIVNSILVMFLFEFFQLINFFPGTFDVLDLLFMFVSVLIYIIINLKLLTKTKTK